jgi:ubiquinone/menaquinone biosynthesis C-methylase UbiE
MAATNATQLPFGESFGGSATENYERFFVPAIGAPLAQDLIAAADLRAGERVLDVACGTGIVARLAAERVGTSGSVAGLDINAGMLAVARSLGRPAGAVVRWYETTAESMPLPDESFDVVLCQLGLQFIADKVAALREMRRVLTREGRLLVTVPTPTEFFNTLDVELSRHIPPAAGFVRMVFSLHDEREIEHLFRDAGFGDVTVKSEGKTIHLPPPKEFLWQYVRSTPLAIHVANADTDTLGALEHDVENAWQPWVSDGGMTYQQGMIVALAFRDDRAN